MGLLNKCAGCVGFLAVFIGVFVPLLLSHTSGGWTRKYTSVGFKTADIPSLNGKVAVVTGANTGIGLESAKELARKGAQVYVLARSETKGKAAVAEINAAIASDSTHIDVEFMRLDLASFKSIKAFADAWAAAPKKPIDILMLNAGIMKSPGEAFVGRKFSYGYDTTAEGFEIHIGVNHLGHFYLTKLMKPFLKEGSRVIAVSSAAEGGAYTDGMRFDLWKQKTDEYEDGLAYGQSKLANIMFARELAERWKEAGIQAYSCHPGIIATELSRYMVDEMNKEAKQNGPVAEFAQSAFMSIFANALFSRADGALTQLHLAVSSGLKNGGYYVPIGTPADPTHGQGGNVTLQKLLWDKSEEAIQNAL